MVYLQSCVVRFGTLLLAAEQRVQCIEAKLSTRVSCCGGC